MNEQKVIDAIETDCCADCDCSCKDCAYPKAISALKAQIKLKEYIERINQPEYNDVVWKKDEVVLLLKELIAE